MTQRERQAPDCTSPVLSRHADSPAEKGDACRWEEIFPGLPAGRQRDLLELAGRQGLLHAQQVGTTSATPDPGRRPLPRSFLKGPVCDLEPHRPPPLSPFDADLDSDQRQAVAGALHTPDIFLIQGQHGTGKSRVVAEIISQCAARGERILFLAPNTAALDHVLVMIGTRPSLYPVRCLNPAETAEQLPACVRPCVLGERVRFFREQTQGAMRRAMHATQEQAEKKCRAEAVWERLALILEQIQRLEKETAAVAARRADLLVEVHAEAGRSDWAPDSSFGKALGALRQRKEETLARIVVPLDRARVDLQAVRTELTRLQTALGPLLPLVEAKRSGRWLTIAWWRASFRSNLVNQVENDQKRIQELHLVETGLAKETADLEEERDQAVKQAQAACEEAITREVSRRGAELDERAALLTVERQASVDEWTTACTALPPSVVPAEPTAAALELARTQWTEHCQAEEQRLEASRRAFAFNEPGGTAGLDEVLQSLPQRLVRCANLVVATPRALAGDPHFGDRTSPPAAFDVLILDDADHVTEADFLHSARRAGRWILVGAPETSPCKTPATPAKHLLAKPSSRTRAIPGHRPQALTPGVFQRLWKNLRWDAARLPYFWEQRGNHVHCRLRIVDPDQEAWVQTERLADRPDVELHILARPRQSSELVEVVFTASTPIPEAKEFLFRELGEVTLQPATSSWHWSESAEHVALHFATTVDAQALRVPLEEGVRELIAAPAEDDDVEEAADWRTCAVEFERSAGWDRDRAAQWAATHLAMRDAGRTAPLHTLHRMRPLLGCWLSHLLHGETATGQHGTGGDPAVEFVIVPCPGNGLTQKEPHQQEQHDSWHGGGTAVATRLRAVHGGAGLEMDLAESRRIDQIPPEIRSLLPPNGIVNYLEAQALVRFLEKLVADPSFGALAKRWHQREGSPCEHGGVEGATCLHAPAVAVIALYPAQADLLNRLLQQAPAVLASSVRVAVGTPAAFQHRECLVTLVSLTRSHTHRAVPYGDAPHSLALALTRATERVVFFGDPGTLARRSNWRGPLDHLDETAAEHERAVAARLVQAIQGTEATPPGFRLREGTLL